MNVYLFATVLGLLGLVIMAALGVAHAAAGGHAHGLANGHAGHSPGHLTPGHLNAGHVNTGHGQLAPAHGPGPGESPAYTHGLVTHNHHAPSGGEWLLTLASPRVLLSVALGFGLVGLLLQHLLPALILLPVAVVGGVLFETLLIRPYWSFLLRFESRPSLTLASVAGSPAQATTDFDERGAGLITFELNGETRQMLAHLENPRPEVLSPEAASRPVRRGEPLTIESIDEPSNRCTVRRS